MRLPVGFQEMFARDMGIDLGRCERGVAEELLDCADVRAGVDEMRREGVAEHMRAALPLLADNRQFPRNDALDLPGRHALSLRIGKKRQVRSMSRFTEQEIAFHGLDRRAGQRDNALLSPLPDNANRAAADRADGKRAELGEPDTAAIEEFDDRMVAALLFGVLPPLGATSFSACCSVRNTGSFLSSRGAEMSFAGLFGKRPFRAQKREKDLSAAIFRAMERGLSFLTEREKVKLRNNFFSSVVARSGSIFLEAAKTANSVRSLR